MGCIESSGSLAGSLPSSPILLPSSSPLLPFLFIAVIRFQPPPFGEKAKKRGCDTVAKRPPSRLMDEIPLLSPSFFEPRSQLETGDSSHLASNYFSPVKIFARSVSLIPISTRHMSVRFTDVRPRSPQTSLRSSLRQPFPRPPDPANLFHAFFPILFPRLFSTY